MILIDNLSKSYDRANALNIDHLQIDPGIICGLVGNNGAGKTTLFSLILDLIKASSGQVTSYGVEVSQSDAWKSFTGAFLSEQFLIEFLTPDEYFSFVAQLHNWSDAVLRTFLDQFTEFFNHEILNTRKYIRELSKGNQKKVGIVGALIGDPKVVLLDESFANLDPQSQNKLRQILIDQKRDDRIIFIASHNLGHVHAVSDRIIILERGIIIRDILKVDHPIAELEKFFIV